GGYGSIEITAMTTDAGQDLLPGKKFVQPDDGNEHDRTLMMVSLNRPVPPKGKITLRFQYVVNMPKVFARMGYAGNFFMAAQWFPKMSVYEPAGTRNRKEDGWNLHQYHGNSEFYADFGIYDVAITVPQTFTVAATGFPTKISRTKDGWKTYRFYADDVHDFAWAASPDFIYAEQPFSAPGVPGVKIKLYLDPRHKLLRDRYFAVVKKSLADYSQWYGEYPYSTLSVVVPPAQANGAGGMEYPTLITAWGADDEKPDLELERVVAHEIGHQYFYGMVATNEFEEAWLDEGFTSYIEAKVMEKEFNVRPNFPLEASYMTTPRALNLNAWQYKRHGDYADNVYIRAKLVLAAIEREIGGENMRRVLRAYFQRYKFRHPSTSDFLAVLEQVTGKQWDDFFKTYVYGGTMTDVSVDGIQITTRLENGAYIYDSAVLVTKRAGDLRQVPVLIRFADGTMTTKNFDASKNNRAILRFTGTAPVEWAMVDPNYSLVLENKHINNFFQTKIDPEQKNRFSIGIAKLIETLLQGIAW
ncbi:MAG TPA: M1 family metallopeptidase, partial [Bacilli bacterium]